MGEKFAKLKDENKILVMLAFFSISKGLWENFRQLWLQDNNLDVTQISQILSIASLCCVIALIVFSKKLSLNKIKSVLSFSIFMKALCLLVLYILNHSGQTAIINGLVILDTIFEKIIIIKAIINFKFTLKDFSINLKLLIFLLYILIIKYKYKITSNYIIFYYILNIYFFKRKI